MKKILFILLIIIFVFVIYSNNKIEDKIYFGIGNTINSDYIYYKDNMRTIDIINAIKDNIKIKNKYIQHILVKSNNIYIDLNNIDNINDDYSLLKDLLELIRIYNKNKIIIKLNSNNTYSNKEIFYIIDKYDIIIKR